MPPVLCIEGESKSTFDLKVKTSHEDETLGGKWSVLRPTKIDIRPQGAKEIILNAFYEGNSNNTASDDMRRQSRVGFWIGVMDSPNDHPQNQTRWFSYGTIENSPPSNTDEPGNSTSIVYQGYELDITEWDFGTKARMHLRRIDETACDTLQLLLVSRPFFKGSNESLPLRVDLEARNDNNGPMGSCQAKITYCIDENLGYGRDDRYEYLSDFGSFELTGTGISVHPKQLFTANVLEDGMKKMTGKASRLNIGYIGPDTTENLRTCIRHLDRSEVDNDNITLHVVCTKEWDIPSAFLPFRGGEMGLENSPIQIKFYDVDSTSESPSDDEEEELRPIDECPDLHILISTYVTHFAVFANSKSRVSYKKTIDRLFKPDTLFYIVEPKDPKNCVVSIPNISNSKKDDSVVEFYVHECDLEKPIPIRWNQDSFINAMRWRKKRTNAQQEGSN